MQRSNSVLITTDCAKAEHTRSQSVLVADAQPAVRTPRRSWIGNHQWVLLSRLESDLVRRQPKESSAFVKAKADAMKKMDAMTANFREAISKDTMQSDIHVSWVWSMPSPQPPCTARGNHP
jgi:hypothetical protein